MVGYITGLIWGLYLKISIVPLIFIALLGIYFVRKIRNRTNKLYTIIAIIITIISNLYISHLEYKFDNLYKGINNMQGIGTIVSEGKVR